MIFFKYFKYSFIAILKSNANAADISMEEKIILVIKTYLAANDDNKSMDALLSINSRNA